MQHLVPVVCKYKRIVYYWWHLRCMMMYGFSLHWNMCTKFNTIVEDQSDWCPILCSPHTHSVLKGIICLVGMDEALNIGQCLRTNLQTTQGHTMATSQVHKSWIDPTLIPTNINGLSKPKRWIKMNRLQVMVALGAARFPHGSHIYFDDFPIEIPNWWSYPQRRPGLGQALSGKIPQRRPVQMPRSDAPGPAWRVIILGLKKKHHVKRMDRAKKHENHL